MKLNPLRILESLGQSIWLDYLSRHAIKSGQLQDLIENDGLSGVTSNPSIFEKAMTKEADYEQDIRALARKHMSPEDIYLALAVKDIQTAADLFRPIYGRTEGRDGFVSLEVSPHLAHDTRGTITEAKRLWAKVNRPNLFIKVPATAEGLPAIQQLIGEGINVNITLLFGLPRYRQVAEAYLAGLEALAAKNKPLAQVSSVASFFLSRIDVLIDPMLEQTVKTQGPNSAIAAECRGEVAIACAKVAAHIHQSIFSGERFRILAGKGARPQRLLWASTSTKNPAYPDLKYVEPIVGPDTINTLPLQTLNAYRDHGNPAIRLQEGLAEAQSIIAKLGQLRIDLDKVTGQLELEGESKFNEAYDLLMRTLAKARERILERQLVEQPLE
jgi:transaldolase